MKKVRGGGTKLVLFIVIIQQTKNIIFLHYFSKVRFPSLIPRHCKKVSGGGTKLVLFISLIKRTRHQDKHGLPEV